MNVDLTMPQLDKLTQLQRENKAWVARNFTPPFYPHRPLLGIVEELGEIEEATEHEAILDGIADVMVFASDFCNMHRFNLASAFAEAHAQFVHGRRVRSTTAVGRLAHAQLKFEQQIRGTADERMEKVLAGLNGIFLIIMARMESLGFPPARIVDVTMKVWTEEVHPRIWRCQKCGAMLPKFTMDPAQARCPGC